MTASVEPQDPSTPLDGRVFHLGPDWALCSFRLPTSMPVPLAMVSPGDIALETWAFGGVTARADRMSCLLLVRAKGAAARTAMARRVRLVVATHFHPVVVDAVPAESADDLSPEDRALMARAVLSALTPGNAAALADPITLLAPALRRMPVPRDAPEVTLSDDRPNVCAVSGTDVPNYLVFDADAGFRCARVATARQGFSPTPRIELDLEPLWGPQAGRPYRTFLVGDRRFTTARLRAIAA